MHKLPARYLAAALVTIVAGAVELTRSSGHQPKGVYGVQHGRGEAEAKFSCVKTGWRLKNSVGFMPCPFVSIQPLFIGVSQLSGKFARGRSDTLPRHE